MRKILITGAAGFIGFHLSRRLLESGDVIIGIDNLNSYYNVNLKKARLVILKNTRISISSRQTLQTGKILRLFLIKTPLKLW
jgi:Nucleoside-diphosphate-sugar epimerases